MAKFKIIISDPEVGESRIVELEGSRAVPLIGRRIGETIDGAAVGLGGHKLKITGGSDKDGFPMRPGIHGGVKTRIIISQGVGFNPSYEGERRRKTVRGSVITDETVQVNMKIAEKPKKTEKAEPKEKQRAESEEKLPEEPEKQTKEPITVEEESKERKDKEKEA
ncbi:MAG: 30S ribosomal protein S6e [Candidatus Bathyarchaeia archaeon]